MADSERQPRRWSSAEDQILREQVEIQQAEGGGRDWCRVASALPGRTNKDCRKRWHNSVAEGLRKGQWSRSEDQLLTNGVHCYGHQWTKVATCVSSRSADQCAKRWQQSLDPRLDHSEWQEDEDLALLTAVNRLGRRWKDIQRQYLPQRSKNCVKNRHSVLARRATLLVPFDDSFESSSSDPDTPLQMNNEIPLESAPMPFMHYSQQTLYPQNSTMGMSSKAWALSGLGNPNVLMTADPHEPFETHTWPSQDSGSHNFVNPASLSNWYNMQTITPSQHPTQYPSISYPPRHGYTTSSPQQLHELTTPSYTSTIRMHVPYAPSTRSPTTSPTLTWPSYQYSDTAPYGYRS